MNSGPGCAAAAISTPKAPHGRRGNRRKPPRPGPGCIHEGPHGLPPQLPERHRAVRPASSRSFPRRLARPAPQLPEPPARDGTASPAALTEGPAPAGPASIYSKLSPAMNSGRAARSASPGATAPAGRHPICSSRHPRREQLAPLLSPKAPRPQANVDLLKLSPAMNSGRAARSASPGATTPAGRRRSASSRHPRWNREVRLPSPKAPRPRAGAGLLKLSPAIETAGTQLAPQLSGATAPASRRRSAQAVTRDGTASPAALTEGPARPAPDLLKLSPAMNSGRAARSATPGATKLAGRRRSAQAVTRDGKLVTELASRPELRTSKGQQRGRYQPPTIL
jgi:hypothetical protein